MLNDHCLPCYSKKTETIHSKVQLSERTHVTVTAEVYQWFVMSSPPLCTLRDLFNAAFVSCWSELNEDQQDELIRSIELALTSQDIAEVTQTLLNLAEFMEHSDKVTLLPRCSDGSWQEAAGLRRGVPVRR